MALPWEITHVAGRPILVMEPHGVDSHPNALGIRGTEAVVPSGARIVSTDPAAPIDRYEFEFIAKDRDEVAFLEGFFDARRGKQEGFWLPTSQWEFDVFGYDMPNFGVYRLWVRRTGYIESLYPLGARFRQILLLRGDTYHAHVVNAVTASVAPGIDLLGLGDGGDHSIPDIAQFFGPTPARNDSYRPLRLDYVRFDQDELVAEVMNGDGACRIALAMVSVPREVPT